MKLTLGELAKHVDGEVVGESDATISGVSEIQNGSPGTITFLGNSLYSKYLKDTKADAVFVDEASRLNGKNGIVVSNPQLAMAKTLKLFSKRQLNDPYVLAAKKDGYRSRSAYKLIEINKKFNK